MAKSIDEIDRFVRPSKKSLHDVNTQETVRPVPVPRPRKSLSATTTEVSSLLNNTATSDDQPTAADSTSHYSKSCETCD